MAMNGMGRTGETGRNQQIGVLRPLSLMLTASWYMGEDGAMLKKKVHMVDGEFADGTAQCLYYPDGHECVGYFKGMGVQPRQHEADPHDGVLKSVETHHQDPQLTRFEGWLMRFSKYCELVTAWKYAL
jgi:hypothetical protein